jgi:hypothetical protein
MVLSIKKERNSLQYKGKLTSITTEVVEAARESLMIGIK